MKTKICTFYATKENIQNIVAQSLRSNGFQVQTEEEKDSDDVASMHSGISNFTDHPQNRAQLSSLMHDRNIPFTKKKSTTSIIQERYDLDNDSQDDVPLANNSLWSLGGPSYVEPQTFSKTGITRYQPRQRVMSLADRLRHEQKLKEEEEKKQQQTKSFLTKVISYIW